MRLSFWILNIVTLIVSPMGVYAFYLIITQDFSGSSSRYGFGAAVGIAFLMAIIVAIVYLFLLISSVTVSFVTIKKYQSAAGYFFIMLFGGYLVYLLSVTGNYAYTLTQAYFSPHLYEAIEMNDLDKVKRAVARGEDFMPNDKPSTSVYFKSPLETAIRMADFDIIKYFVEKGVPVDELTIVLASRFNRYKTLRYLLENGGNANSIHFRERSALLESDSNETIDVLLEFNANPNQLSDEKRTPLMLAAVMCNKYKLEKLLTHGARIDLIDSQGFSALMFASRCPASMVKELINKKQVNAQNDRNLSVLSIYVERQASTSYVGRDAYNIECTDVNPIKDYVANIELLLKAGANPNQRDGDGYTPLSRLFSRYLISGIKFYDDCSKQKYPETPIPDNASLLERLNNSHKKDQLIAKAKTNVAKLLIKYGARLDLPLNLNDKDFKATILESIIKNEGAAYARGLQGH